MPHAVWTPFAESELDDIIFYIAVEDRRPMTGEQVYLGIRRAADEQASMNRPGHRHARRPRKGGSTGERGRDGRYRPPPAQIRT